jgi:hypothetical protein
LGSINLHQCAHQVVTERPLQASSGGPMQNANNTKRPRRGDHSSGADLGTEGRSSHMLRLDLVSPVQSNADVGGTIRHRPLAPILDESFHDLFKYFNANSLFKISGNS